MYVIKGKYNWQLVVGLEVHCQILSKSKLFSASSTQFGNPANSNVGYYDAGFSGFLPVLNRFCVEQAIKTALALNFQLNEYSRFDRKNYFYADLPLGYQLTQYYYPLAQNGFLNVDLGNEVKRVSLQRLHMECDAGKSLHDMIDGTAIDLNRAGIGLMEIVTAPEIHSPHEVSAFLKTLRQVVQNAETCSGKMEQGAFRCDANVSVRKIVNGSTMEEYGQRVEIKNLNSFRYAKKAVEYEAHRQVALLEGGGTVRRETRGYNFKTGQTFSMRGKEEAVDYRYYPDPDLPPILIKINKH